MTKFPYMLASAAVLSIFVCATPQVLAHSQAQGQAKSQISVPHFTKTQQENVNLPPMIVQGHRLPFVVEMQLFKKALDRPWSSSDADRYKLVCRWVIPVGTHFQSLNCLTNGQHWAKMRNVNLATMAHGLKGALAGQVPAQVVEMVNSRRISRSTMAGLLAQLPPANASYTFRITGDNGKPLLDYVIKQGELTHIYQYVYKSDKASKDNP